MKNSHNNKFNRQLGHMQSFIGMPHQYQRKLTQSEIREMDRQIIEQQAKGFQAARKGNLLSVSSWIITGISGLFIQNTNQAKPVPKQAREKSPKSKEPVEIGSMSCS